MNVVEKIVTCSSLRDLVRKVEHYKNEGGRVDEYSIRQTGATTYIFKVEYADNPEYTDNSGTEEGDND